MPMTAERWRAELFKLLKDTPEGVEGRSVCRFVEAFYAIRSLQTVRRNGQKTIIAEQTVAEGDDDAKW